MLDFFAVYGTGLLVNKRAGSIRFGCAALLLVLLVVSLTATGRAQSGHGADVGWSVYNGGKDGDHYSPLVQINRANVHTLRPTWTFDPGEKGGLQTNPLIAGHMLLGYTASQKVFALDAATGKRLWLFDSGMTGAQPIRGLSYWTDGRESILFAGVKSFIYALDPATGKPIVHFGEQGRIDLRKSLGDDAHYDQLPVVLTTPGILYRDLLITGFRTAEAVPAPPGDIRAYDVHSGALRWSFHTIPHPGEFGYDTWPKDAWKSVGSANNWPGMALDEQRGIVYVPTGSPVSDFYGYDRIGNGLFGDSLLALDAGTGKRIWHFQSVHHDIWDRDFPSPPALVSVRKDGRQVDAVAQTSKQGFVYLFDRVTGKPLFPMEEHAYPSSTVPGEHASPTQPLPTAPAPFARQLFTADMITQLTPEVHTAALQQFVELRSAGQFIPFAVDRQTVVFPGFDGGAEWGGPAIDPTTGVLYVNANDVPWTGGLVENKSSGGGPGQETYLSSCASCHGDERRGSPPAFPTLVGVTQRLSDVQIEAILANGRGRMPAFPNVTGDRLTQLLAYLRTDPGSDSVSASAKPVAMSGGANADSRGAHVYAEQCAVCHGDDLAGIGQAFPALVGIATRRNESQVLSIVHEGRGRMPAFQSRLSQDDVAHLLRFLGVAPMSAETVAASTSAPTSDMGAGMQQASGKSDKQELAGAPENTKGSASPRYRFTGYRKFLDADGYPAVVPPWGTLNAIDLNTGKYLWKIPLGQYPELAAKGMKNTGSENYGGPVVTAGGLVFIGATVYDDTMRAFDSSTGKLLWEAKLPFAGVATPAVYMVDGREYVVIAASGGRNAKEGAGGVYVAFALPERAAAKEQARK